MGNNIVVFGKGNTGKTTLIGYMFAHKSERNVVNSILEKKRIDLGSKYDDRERYSYLISSLDEIREYSGGENDGNEGNTKRLHFSSLGQGIVIIDTPGVEHSQSLTTLKDKGIFMGDIGIYVVDVGEILKFESDFSIFSHVFLWSTLRPNKLIIAMSKVDLHSSDEVKEAYEKAESIFNEQAKLNAKIVPISVNRDEGIIADINIYRKDDNMKFFLGDTIANNIKKLSESNVQETDDSKFCIYAEKFFDHDDKQGAGVGRTWRNKVLSGCIRKGSSIKMLPVKYEREYTIAYAKIKNIRMLADEKNSDSGKAGEIIGLDISNIRIREKNIDKSEITTTTGTLFVSDKCKVHWGNIIRFRLEKEVLIKYRKFRLKETVRIFWFGHVVEAIIINQYDKEDQFFFIAWIKDSFVVMPIINNAFLIKHIPLMYVEEVKDESKKYINVYIDKIGQSDCVYIVCDNDIDMVFSKIDQHLVGKDLDLSIKDNNRIVVQTKHATNNALYTMIKDMECAFNKDECLFGLDSNIHIKINLVVM
jgi:translation elongation factor EF-1alpha